MDWTQNQNAKNKNEDSPPSSSSFVDLPTTGPPPFPRWNSNHTISQQELLSTVLELARQNSNNNKGSSSSSSQQPRKRQRRPRHAGSLPFHMVHLLRHHPTKKKLTFASWWVPQNDDQVSRQHWFRARVMMVFLARRRILPLLERDLFHANHHNGNGNAKENGNGKNNNNRSAYPVIRQQLETHGAVMWLANYGDAHVCHSSWAVLTLSAPLHCPTAFPVPNYELIRLALRLGNQEDNVAKRQRLQRSKHQHQQIFDRKAWESQKPIVIWRGSPTGHGNPKLNHRVKLCQYAQTMNQQQNHTLIDAKIVLTKPRHYQMLKNTNATQYQSIIAPRKMASFDPYRAVLDIDGNSWSSRFASLLCGNRKKTSNARQHFQIVLKVQPGDVDSFYPHLVPGRHYLPVHANFSNLQSQAARAVSDVALAAHMARATHLWCQSYVTLSRLAEETAATWEEYTKVLSSSSVGNDQQQNNNNDKNKTTITQSLTHQVLSDVPWEQHHDWNQHDARLWAKLVWKKHFVWK